MKNYGAIIRELREKNNDTLEDLAKKLGITLSALSKIELGHRKAKTELIEEIANIYGVPTAYFFGEEIEVPEELKDVGVELIRMAKELKDRKLTPKQIQDTIEFMEKMGIAKKE